MKLILFLAIVATAFVAQADFSRIGRGANVVCSGTPTELDDPSISNSHPRYILITNLDEAEAIFLGNSEVDPNHSTPVAPGGQYPSGTKYTGAEGYWCVTTGASVNVRIQEYM